MSFHLTHHRAFCENLGRLSGLEVSWDGHGALPLKRKALQAAMELFGRRPDLTIGSRTVLRRGGLDINLFRGGWEIQVQICQLGRVMISGRDPGRRPDFMISEKIVTEPLLGALRDLVPVGDGLPILDRTSRADTVLQQPFEGFVVLRLHVESSMTVQRLMVGREGPAKDLYAYHDALDLPDEVWVDQPLTGQTKLGDLISSYVMEARTPVC